MKYQRLLLLLLTAILLLVITAWLSGCQWSSYNTTITDPNGRVERVGIGTIEFLVVDSKDGLTVKLKDGTTLTLGSTTTDPDEEAIRAGLDKLIEMYNASLGVSL